MGKTILIVEDDPDMRSGLEAALELEDYNVLAVENGKEALAFLATSMPDLILADLKMPHMACRACLSCGMRGRAACSATRPKRSLARPQPTFSTAPPFWGSHLVVTF